MNEKILREYMKKLWLHVNGLSLQNVYKSWKKARLKYSNFLYYSNNIYKCYFRVSDMILLQFYRIKKKKMHITLSILERFFKLDYISLYVVYNLTI